MTLISSLNSGSGFQPPEGGSALGNVWGHLVVMTREFLASGVGGVGEGRDAVHTHRAQDAPAESGLPDVSSVKGRLN